MCHISIVATLRTLESVEACRNCGIFGRTSPQEVITSRGANKVIVTHLSADLGSETHVLTQFCLIRRRNRSGCHAMHIAQFINGQFFKSPRFAPRTTYASVRQSVSTHLTPFPHRFFIPIFIPRRTICSTMLHLQSPFNNLHTLADSSRCIALVLASSSSLVTQGDKW